VAALYATAVYVTGKSHSLHGITIPSCAESNAEARHWLRSRAWERNLAEEPRVFISGLLPNLLRTADWRSARLVLNPFISGLLLNLRHNEALYR
jgi:hypothetical protein